MAIVDRPDNLTLDSARPNDSIVQLAETGDVVEENLSMSGLISWVRDRYIRSKDQRLSDETRWLKAYRNYRGIYGPEVQFTDTEKSRTFIKITKTKVLAAYAQLVDVLFAGNRFPVGVEARRYPSNVLDSVHFDPKEVNEDTLAEAETGQRMPSTISRPDILELSGLHQKSLERIPEDLREGPGLTPTAMTFEPAKDAARRMEKKIHDQLDETEASKHLRSTAFEMALFGSGAIKGPFAFDKEYARWNEEGEYDPIIETIPKIESPSIWNIYPDPDARNMSECEYMVERHKYNRTQLRALKRRPYFREESIETAIEMGPNYVSEYWESVLEDNRAEASIERWEVLEYWGIIDAELAERAELEIPDQLKDKDEIQINAWVCNGQILRLVLNPFTPVRIPYSIVPYELNPYSIFGIGVAENMEDTQLLMNGFIRIAVDNAALSSNLLIEIDETNLVPGQDMSLYPGKIFRRQAGAPGQAIFGTKFPNVTQECLLMFDKARQLSDEGTGIPSFSHGSTGVMGVGRTASGMSMLMGAAAQNIKSVVRNIDDYLLAPMGKALFAFNMQFNFDKQFIGDLEIIPRGTESLMRNEIRSQRLLQFMQMAANPAMAPFVKFDYILREMAASMDLDEDKILNDPREAAIQAQMMAALAATMAPGEGVAGDPMAAGAPAGLNDPTGNGGGVIAPGAAPEPGAEGFTGAGGGANGGAPPPQAGQQPMPPMQ
jgi:hypothetical protein